jgi:chlorite dismutase
MVPMFTTFRGGQSGAWRVLSQAAVKGAGLLPKPALSTVESTSIALPILPSQTSWRLAGVASHGRYVERGEKERLVAVQAGLGRPEATRAALIPIKKSQAWWDLTQEERRRIFEDKSQHIAASTKYLPAIARQLYHCRDLGEPFDFLTWFEYDPANAALFEELVAMLRGTEEWTFVEREVDLRLERERLDAG